MSCSSPRAREDEPEEGRPSTTAELLARTARCASTNLAHPAKLVKLHNAQACMRNDGASTRWLIWPTHPPRQGLLAGTRSISARTRADNSAAKRSSCARQGEFAGGGRGELMRMHLARTDRGARPPGRYEKAMLARVSAHAGASAVQPPPPPRQSEVRGEVQSPRRKSQDRCNNNTTTHIQQEAKSRHTLFCGTHPSVCKGAQRNEPRRQTQPHRGKVIPRALYTARIPVLFTRHVSSTFIQPDKRPPSALARFR
jgi:hypothetical protein